MMTTSSPNTWSGGCVDGASFRFGSFLFVEDTLASSKKVRTPVAYGHGAAENAVRLRI
jgi:hypothetical protein